MCFFFPRIPLTHYVAQFACCHVGHYLSIDADMFLTCQHRADMTRLTETLGMC